MRYIHWCLFACVGCATPMSAMREDNRRLVADVAELRADRRAQDRKIRDLENQLAIAQTKSGDVPALPVEVMTPAPTPPATRDDVRVVGVADDGTEIVYEGDAALGKPATLDDHALEQASGTTSAPPPPPPLASLPSASDRLEVMRGRIPPVSARAPHTRPRAVDVAAQPAGDAAGDYRAAVELVKAGKPDDAIAALRAFVQRHPRHELDDNAQYWIGEVYYAQKDYPHALTEFRATIETYPRGNKVPDALLKLGYCYQALGEREKARAVLAQVVSLYPKSEPAVLAAKRLESP